MKFQCPFAGIDRPFVLPAETADADFSGRQDGQQRVGGIGLVQYRKRLVQSPQRGINHGQAQINGRQPRLFLLRMKQFGFRLGFPPFKHMQAVAAIRPQFGCQAG
jgi:hypothetical protein